MKYHRSKGMCAVLSSRSLLVDGMISFENPITDNLSENTFPTKYSCGLLTVVRLVGGYIEGGVSKVGRFSGSKAGMP